MKKIKSPSRRRFPNDEGQHPWLPLLLDVHAVIDRGVAHAIREEQRERGAKLACTRGCSSCCSTHHDIPVYPLEVRGIFWYVTEKIDGPLRAVLKNQLSIYLRGQPCPFLVDRACSIHPLRPMACRQFNVFSRPCSDGEDPFYTRRADVMSPLQSYADRAFMIMLPFHGVTDDRVKEELIRNRLVHTMVRILQDCNWPELAQRMDGHDSGKH